MMMTMAEAMDASALVDWMRGFAVGKLPVCENPDVALIHQAIARYLPEKVEELSSDASASDLLQNLLHISVIMKFGREKAGWVSVADPDEARALQQLLDSEPYHQARQTLGIDLHWIFEIEPSRLKIYDLDHLMDAAPDPLEVYESIPAYFRLEDRKTCVVVNL
jgi:hypothetical protein